MKDPRVEADVGSISKRREQSCYAGWQRRRRRGDVRRILMSEQDAHVLDRRDQVILDLLSPACAFEMMVVGISKTTLH
jgi:hypothetical protein